MKKKIFWSTMLVALIVLLASSGIILGYLYSYFENIQEQQMKDELGLAVEGVADAGLAFLEDLDYEEYRLTWVADDGDVLFDSEAEEDDMENHRSRLEIQEAFMYGSGEVSRYSSTMTEKTLYYARRVDDNSVLRISVSRATAALLMINMLLPIVFIVILAIVLSAILAKNEAKNITEPLNQLNLERPLDNDAYEELRPLLVRIERQQSQITAAVQELKRRKEDFAQITAFMKEGLVLLNEKGVIVSINPAAEQILHTDSKAVGQNFLQIEQNADIISAMECSIHDGHGEARNVQDDIEYQYDFSRIESDQQSVGTVVLIFDVTEQAQMERTRREFTANVSHELKTPLQSIIGSAELIENGMVKEEDMPRFVTRIRTESARLVNLINDIIHLSRMDSGMDFPQEEVDLCDIAEEAIEAVRDAAQKKNVKISLKGDTSAIIKGVPQLLYELIYNLCDNAIRYNKEGGSVLLRLSQKQDGVLFQISDTGIGIPHEHLHRIFERFYRVDKSHSRQSGGTGLGLSIVKHAAAYHHAKIEIQSEVGKGTDITVCFCRG